MSVVNVSVKHLRKMGYASLEAWLEDPNNVYIGRKVHYVKGTFQSKWANPYSVGKYGRNGALRMYRNYLTSKPELMQELATLENKNLGCWCDPDPCHGHILMSFLKKTHKDV